MPQTSLRVVVTRPAAQAAQWVAALRERGVDAVAVSLIAIGPATDRAAVAAQWRSLAERDLVVFVSPNAVERFDAERPAGAPWPERTLAAAPGPGTRVALLGCGVPAAHIVEPAADAAQFDSESLWRELSRRSWAGASVLVVRGEGAHGRDELARELTAAGARVDFVAAYRRGPPQPDADEGRALATALAAPERHAWLFSSSQAIDHLAGLGGAAPALSRALAIATHPRIAERAREAGFGRVQPCRPTLDAVVACLQSAAAAPHPPL